MSRRSIALVLMSVFFVAMVASIIWVNSKRPRLLVLHSYDTHYVWTREINTGLERVLGKQSWINVRYHYMDTKKKSNKSHLHRAGISAREAIDQIKPDVVIAIDDGAQKLAAMKYVNHPDINIVFAGINGSIRPYGYRGANNVTGILERKPVAAIREVVQFFTSNAPPDTVKNPQNPRVIFLADASHSTERDAEYMATHDWKPVDYKGVETAGTFGEWKKAVKGMRGKTDFLLVGGYRKLHRTGPDSKFVPADEVMSWTEANSPVIVLGINVFNTEDGAMLSVGVSPYEQGEIASQMALKIIKEGVSPKAIPIVTSSQYVISMRRSSLERRKINVPQIFEAFARATNNYYK
jgi:ABC-type uncharacterized transport system substrate-binding protein